MLWKGRRQSDNVEDRRGITGRGVALGGGLGALALTIIVLLLGGNPQEVMQNLQTAQPANQEQAQPLTQEEKELGEFVGVILADTEDVWNQVFQQGRAVPRPQAGPVHQRHRVGLRQRPGGRRPLLLLGRREGLHRPGILPGDAAEDWERAAISPGPMSSPTRWATMCRTCWASCEQAQEKMQGLSREEANRMSVRLELHADFLAGVWANHAERMKGILEAGDIEEGMNAAAAVGDDRIMKRQQGYVVPDAFTHGTSAQRVRWFTLGFKTGDMSQGDIFAALRNCKDQRVRAGICQKPGSGP